MEEVNTKFRIECSINRINSLECFFDIGMRSVRKILERIILLNDMVFFGEIWRLETRLIFWTYHRFSVEVIFELFIQIMSLEMNIIDDPLTLFLLVISLDFYGLIFWVPRRLGIQSIEKWVLCVKRISLLTEGCCCPDRKIEITEGILDSVENFLLYLSLVYRVFLGGG